GRVLAGLLAELTGLLAELRILPRLLTESGCDVRLLLREVALRRRVLRLAVGRSLVAVLLLLRIVRRWLPLRRRLRRVGGRDRRLPLLIGVARMLIRGLFRLLARPWLLRRIRSLRSAHLTPRSPAASPRHHFLLA